MRGILPKLFSGWNFSQVPSGELQLRTYRPGDLERSRRAALYYHQDAEDWPVMAGREIEEILNDPCYISERQSIMAEEEGLIVGGVYCWWPAGKDRALVACHARDKQIAEKLIGEALTLCRRSGIPVIEFFLDSERRRALEQLRDLGFLEDRRLLEMELDQSRWSEIRRRHIQVETSNFQIRRYRGVVEDEALLYLHNIANADQPGVVPYDMARLYYWMNIPGFERDNVFVAEIEGRLVGECWTWPGMQGVGEITNVAVLPGYRRRGVGKMMLVGAIQHLFERGMQKASLGVIANNLPAHLLYTQLGFHATRTMVYYHREIG
ncbi:MAG: GNAT family N-acetyltransferase [Chloroflexi bacterium]|nr:GNAT family N-acetyltransferase [Chloroflexota bacterium]